jgi:uncharacterized glyoxalase superfamily protein PhnB
MTSKTPPKQSPNSVGFTSSDMKRSIAFYRDRLGFQLSECWPDEKNPMWANLVLRGQSVMFGGAMSPDQVEKMCSSDPLQAKYFKRKAEEYAKTPARGVGVNVYLEVEDVDAYAATIQERGVQLELPPKSQFYGLRNIVVSDPDGYQLTFYTPIKMSACQSCAMPLADAAPGQMYCDYCTDESGKLKPYEQILAGTIHGYFVAHLKMPLDQAEKAAREHLAKQPAWAGHC